ncbi:MAG: hypothetical protein HQL51_10525 [Magnetococcales bacterium]|nr:hypothetical protein [Magnetococcales bacterium]
MTDADTRLEGRENDSRESSQESEKPRNTAQPTDASGPAAPLEEGRENRNTLADQPGQATNPPSAAQVQTPVNAPTAAAPKSGDLILIHPSKQTHFECNGQVEKIKEIKEHYDRLGVPASRQQIYLHTQNFEDGMGCESPKDDPSKDVCGGVKQKTLDDFRKAHPELKLPAKVTELTPEHLAKFHESYAGAIFRFAGGKKILDEKENKEIAAAVYDTLFKRGEGLGAFEVRKAIMKTTGDDLKNTPSLAINQNHVNLLRNISRDGDMSRKFLDNLYEVRKEENGGKDTKDNRFY